MQINNAKWDAVIEQQNPTRSCRSSRSHQQDFANTPEIVAALKSVSARHKSFAPLCSIIEAIGLLREVSPPQTKTESVNASIYVKFCIMSRSSLVGFPILRDISLCGIEDCVRAHVTATNTETEML